MLFSMGFRHLSQLLMSLPLQIQRKLKMTPADVRPINYGGLYKFIFILAVLFFLLYSKWTHPWIEKHLARKTSLDDFFTGNSVQSSGVMLIYFLLAATLAWYSQEFMIWIYSLFGKTYLYPDTKSHWYHITLFPFAVFGVLLSLYNLLLNLKKTDSKSGAHQKEIDNSKYKKITSTKRDHGKE